MAGTGRVNEDGSLIETIKGGVRGKFRAFSGDGKSNDEDGDNGDGKQISCGSMISLSSSCVASGFALPAYVSQGVARSLKFVYASERAHLQEIIPFEATILQRTAVPQTLSVDVSFGGLNSAVTAFIDTSGLDESLDEDVRLSLPLDVSDLSTGVYTTKLRLTSHYANASVGTDLIIGIPCRRCRLCQCQRGDRYRKTNHRGQRAK